MTETQAIIAIILAAVLIPGSAVAVWWRYGWS
jgi:hypothetical protein